MRTLIEGVKLDTLLEYLSRAPAGIAVELGVYMGGAIEAMARAAPDRALYGFDTFTGMPAEKWQDGEPHGIGDFRDTDFEAVAAGMPENVTLIRGVFPESADGLNLGTIAFAHVDFDWYESTREAINWLLPRLAHGAIVVFDDWEWKHCPGVKQAITEAGLAVRTAANQAIYFHES